MHEGKQHTLALIEDAKDNITHFESAVSHDPTSFAYLIDLQAYFEHLQQRGFNPAIVLRPNPDGSGTWIYTLQL